MRVLHVYSGNLYGGIETVLATLARQDRRGAGWEHAFALCFEGRLSQELQRIGAPAYALGAARCSRPETVRQARARLRSLLEREGFDAMVCHAAWSQALFASVAKRLNMPRVFWLHDAMRRRTWLDWWAEMSRPNLVIANSRYTASTAHVDAARLRVLYYPVSAAAAMPYRESAASLRRRFDTGPDDVVILQSSRLERWKGHLLLLEALAELRQMPGWCCWIAGGAQRLHEEAYAREMRAAAARFGIAGRIRFLGQRQDVSDLLWACDIHCQPNTGPEPFGVAFIEALQHARPVVTTGMGAAPEIVTPGCGVLAPPRASDLARALRRLIEDRGLRQQLGQAGPARAHELCHPAAQMAKLDVLLSEAAAGRTRERRYAHSVS